MSGLLYLLTPTAMRGYDSNLQDNYWKISCICYTDRGHRKYAYNKGK